MRSIQSKLPWVLVFVGPVLLLFLLLVFPAPYFSVHPSPDRQSQYDFSPTVLIGGEYYIYRGSIHSYAELPEGAEYLGARSDCVSSDQQPAKDFQANDALDGCPVYRKDGQTILVEVDGA